MSPMKRSQNYREPSLNYRIWFNVLYNFCFLAILIIPWAYDQLNLKSYIIALETNNIVVREYFDSSLKANITSSNNNHTQESQAEQNNKSQKYVFPINDVKNKKIISMDYVHQMEMARNLIDFQFGWRAAFLTILSILLLYLFLRFFKNHLWRVPTIFLLFIIALATMWILGLPHVNYKFHVIVGIIFAASLATTDFLNTLNIDIENSEVGKNTDGFLACLQYKHRFWCVVFHAVILTLLTLFGTVSFKTLDSFYKVFGENFVNMPLVGISISLAILLFIVVVGILQPIRQYISSIEIEMKTLS